MTESSTPSVEEMLKAIIEAQGSTHAWSTEDWTLDLDDNAVIVHQDMGDKTNDIRCGILEILLDTDGCKAVWGDKAREMVETLAMAWFDGGVDRLIHTAFINLPIQ